MLTLRPLTFADPPVLAAAFAALGWDKPLSLYTRYLEQQAAGLRAVILAEADGVFAGYLTVVWSSNYPPFQQAGIPEIVDFNVLPVFRRQGIGSALMDTAEDLIAARSASAGIGVGLTPDYGPAHILYVRRGYLPDGRGIWCAGRWVQWGETFTLDDDAALYFTRQVS